MAMSEDFNFSELCRLCSLKSSHQLQIFDKEGEQRQLLFKIRSCIPAVITKEDALPKNICQRCVYKLDMFYEFRLSCMATENVLKNYADSIKHLAAVVNSQVIPPGTPVAGRRRNINFYAPGCISLVCMVVCRGGGMSKTIHTIECEGSGRYLTFNCADATFIQGIVPGGGVNFLG
ncbi:uncharacterized protein LOC117182022 [Belonocnema kinseyi]|uniref:uncharacterized protein LOC117182022 n=1 Tax=Belonocnema kinseyi TaxID=2817044 RepID=UPI00143DBB98|nr:uncharacterized protein LOC117182022 [Belonocnema kinseyi]